MSGDSDPVADEAIRAWLREVAALWEESGPCELPPPPDGLPPVTTLELRPVLEMSDVCRGSMTDLYDPGPSLSEPIVMHPIAFEARVIFAGGREVTEWTGAMPNTAARAESAA